MQPSYNFIIESEGSGHTLFVDGRKLAKFATIGDAEARANEIARRPLHFELDFMWTLTDLEIRVAT
jgi:hypothetical protein